MAYDPEIHHRRTIRLCDYDYAAEGFYFVTICVHEHRALFGTIVDGTMLLNDAGRMVEEEYRRLPNRYHHVICHEYVVMPNHFHAIIQITNDNASPVGAPLVGAHENIFRVEPNENHQGTHKECPYGVVTPSSITHHQGTHEGCPYGVVALGEIVGAFKSITTNAYIRGVKQNGWPPFHTRLWQRNYYEHIIRDQHSHDEIAAYILENPLHWPDDKLYVP